MDEGTTAETKMMLDDMHMHKRKNDMNDEIFVINVGGCTGESLVLKLFFGYQKYLDVAEKKTKILK